MFYTFIITYEYKDGTTRQDTFEIPRSQMNYQDAFRGCLEALNTLEGLGITWMIKTIECKRG